MDEFVISAFGKVCCGRMSKAASTSAAVVTVAGITVAVGVAYALRRVRILRSLLAKETELRASERQGRIRAEQKLREAASKPVSTGGASAEGSSTNVLPVTPIGYVTSCYQQRLGTPRQPGVAPSARASISFLDCLNFSALTDGLEKYSHVWVVYQFHENTNAPQAAADPKDPFKGLMTKIKPPRANGIKVGCLACRSPHRPNPIGLSVARLVRIDKKCLVLEGLDCLHGTPVLDIKPYVPMFDAIEAATVPDWVQESYDRAMLEVDTSQIVALPTDLRPFDNKEQFLAALRETLSLDFRSPHQRNLSSQAGSAPYKGEFVFHGLHVHFRMEGNKAVVESTTRRPIPKAQPQ